jgi:hypothetical protein
MRRSLSRSVVEQQGSGGLETLGPALIVGWSTRL